MKQVNRGVGIDVRPLVALPGDRHQGDPVFDAIFIAAHIEHMGDIACGWPVGVAWWQPELDAVIGQHGMDFVGHNGDQSHEEG